MRRTVKAIIAASPTARKGELPSARNASPGPYDADDNTSDPDALPIYDPAVASRDEEDGEGHHRREPDGEEGVAPKRPERLLRPVRRRRQHIGPRRASDL